MDLTQASRMAAANRYRRAEGGITFQLRFFRPHARQAS